MCLPHENKMNSFTAVLDGVVREFVNVMVRNTEDGEEYPCLAGIGEYPDDIENYPQLEKYDEYRLFYWFKDHDEALELLNVEGAFGDDTLVYAPYKASK